MDEIQEYGAALSRSSQLPRALRANFRAIVLDEDYRAIHLPAGVRLDLGGIAKGWIAEQAALRLAGYARACVVNAGGAGSSCIRPCLHVSRTTTDPLELTHRTSASADDADATNALPPSNPACIFFIVLPPLSDKVEHESVFFVQTNDSATWMTTAISDAANKATYQTIT